MALPDELAGKAPLPDDLHRSMVLHGAVAGSHPEVGQVEQSELVLGVLLPVVEQLQTESAQPCQSAARLARHRNHEAHVWA